VYTALLRRAKFKTQQHPLGEKKVSISQFPLSMGIEHGRFSYLLYFIS